MPMAESAWKPARRFWRAAAVALAALCAGGCSQMGYYGHAAELKLKGRILVVPLSDADNYYYDSKEGVAIAEAVVGELVRNSKTLDPIPPEKAKGPVRSAILGPVDWAEVGGGTGADYVLYGSLDELLWKDPADPMLPRCVFRVTYSVYSVALKTNVYTSTKAGKYPHRLLSDSGVSVYEMGTDLFTERSYQYIGHVIARTFYRYESSPSEEESIKSIPRDAK